MDDRDKLKQAVLKKAIGYSVDEVTEEFGQNDGEMVLLKRKVTTKHIPPDTTAAKIILEMTGGQNIEKMSKFELEAEKKRIMDELAALGGKSKKNKAEDN